MKYIVAVSGGVDSVVLLHMLAEKHPGQLVVAHFDHGIRTDSAADARFVEELAEQYRLPFVTKREELGMDASEDLARTRRYRFLRSAAKQWRAQIVTAHHQDDIVETIAINMIRGTGWRGLAVMGDRAIERPLQTMTKREIYEYALDNSLEWVEDHTNNSDKYLRNRVRSKIVRLAPADREKLLELHRAQHLNRTQIDDEARLLTGNSRHFMTMVDEQVAVELLRTWLDEQGLSLTRPQRVRLLHAIKTAKPGQVFEAGMGCSIVFTRREFIVKNPL